MAAKEKACKLCKTIFESGEKCPKCDSRDFNENFKGKIIIINPEKSEIAKNVDIKDKGTFAIKTR